MSDQGIWKYKNNLLPLLPKFQLSLGEGGTPLRKVGGIYFKCEFGNPNGSYKDRSLAYQISHIYSLGIKKAVISSSGNAAISAFSYCKKVGIDLQVFVSPKINHLKKKVLEKVGIKFNISKTPIKSAFQYAKNAEAYNLRSSVDPIAQEGYKTIAFEILEEVDPDAIFVPVSSGTAFVGIARGFEFMRKKLPMNTVQTTCVHPVAAFYDANFTKTEKSLADAIVARFTPLQEKIMDIISESKGSGWVISDEEILEADKDLKNNNIICSYEGAMALAAYKKAIKKGQNFKNPVCILSGKLFKIN
jgi:threonine synthase